MKKYKEKYMIFKGFLNIQRRLMVFLFFVNAWKMYYLLEIHNLGYLLMRTRFDPDSSYQ